MPAHCCVPECSGKGGHRFPSNSALKTRWNVAVRRGEPGWKPNHWTTVCRAHFDEDDYVKETREGDAPLLLRLKKDAVPHIFHWKKAKVDSARKARARKRLQYGLPTPDTSAWETIGAEETVPVDNPSTSAVMFEEIPSDCIAMKDTEMQTTAKCGFRSTDFMFDKKRFNFYTGLEDYALFSLLLAYFGNVVNELNYYYKYIPSLSPEDQFYLTLMKLRLARSSYELSGLFQISEKDVTNIFVTWINFLYCEFKEIDFWPSRELVKFFSPSDFKKKYPTTRVIIDGTEIPIKKPKQPLAQQATYSTYKNRNTVKVLVGVTPGGLVSFISQCYGGSASDRQICERSPLPNLCDPGDSIMSDKGFNVQDLFISSQVTVNIPEFFKKKNRMSSKSVLSDRKIASKRVHVERIIGLAKTFKILTTPMNPTQSDLADAIISVCFFLCNFKVNIVPEDA